MNSPDAAKSCEWHHASGGVEEVGRILARGYRRAMLRRRRKSSISAPPENFQRPLAVPPNQSVYGGRTSPEGDTNHCPNRQA